MFSGEFEHTIDEKGRLTIPAKFRPLFEEGMFITRGLDGCLFAYPLAAWTILANKIAELSLARSDARFFSRMIFSGTECQLDKQGRILLPASLREHAAIENEVVIVGLNSRLEIWSKERWRQVTEKIQTEGSLFAEKLADMGI